MDSDQVRDLMDDIDEQREVAKEIADAISNPGFNNAIDEAEFDEALLRELVEFEQEALDKDFIDARAPPVTLPDTPNIALPASRPRAKEADKDLEDLESWAN